MSESIAIGHEAQADKTWGIAVGTRAHAADVRSWSPSKIHWLQS